MVGPPLRLYFPPGSSPCRGCLARPIRFPLQQLEKIYRAKGSHEKKYRDWNAYYLAHFSHWYPWGVMIYDQFIRR